MIPPSFSAGGHPSGGQKTTNEGERDRLFWWHFVLFVSRGSDRYGHCPSSRCKTGEQLRERHRKVSLAFGGEQCLSPVCLCLLFETALVADLSTKVAVLFFHNFLSKRPAHGVCYCHPRLRMQSQAGTTYEARRRGFTLFPCCSLSPPAHSIYVLRSFLKHFCVSRGVPLPRSFLWGGGGLVGKTGTTTSGLKRSCYPGLAVPAFYT